MDSQVALSAEQAQVAETVYLLPIGRCPLLVRDPYRATGVRVFFPRRGMVEARLITATTRGGRTVDWYVIDELGGRGLPVRKWLELEKRESILIGRPDPV